MTQTPFDPWDWLGVHCGGYFQELDRDIIATLEGIADPTENDETLEAPYRNLICTLLCNSDDFNYDGDPSTLTFIGGSSFNTIHDLIDAMKTYYQARWGSDYEYEGLC